MNTTEPSMCGGNAAFLLLLLLPLVLLFFLDTKAYSKWRPWPLATTCLLTLMFTS